MDIDKILEGFTADPAAGTEVRLTDEEKERMFAMSEKKYRENADSSKNINTPPDNGTQVSGVEQYKRPHWQRGISIAAALAIAAGAVGGDCVPVVGRSGDRQLCHAGAYVL